MRTINKKIAIILITTFMLMINFETYSQILHSQQTKQKIVFTEKVGSSIDLQERNYYGLFLTFKNFQKAEIFQTADTSYVLKITSQINKTGSMTQDVLLKKSQLKKLQKYLIEFTSLKNLEKTKYFTAKEAILFGLVKPKYPLGLSSKQIQQHEFLQAKMQAYQKAKELAKEKWNEERWKDEILNDRGRSYRSSGAMIGFTLGAAAGMLIGNGFQGKEVARTEYHEPGWFNDSGWTEEFYSYKLKNAPHIGAVLGAIGGAVGGYYLGKKEDKKYYIRVTGNIRKEKTSSSWFKNMIWGFVVAGPVVGGISGWALHTPSSGSASETQINPVVLLGGYVFGAVSGTLISAGLNGRNKRNKLWEKSLFDQQKSNVVAFKFFPTEPNTFFIKARKLPSGDIFYEYKKDVLRLDF